jgi:hypothetical protein
MFTTLLSPCTCLECYQNWWLDFEPPVQSRQACQPSQFKLTYLDRSRVARGLCGHRLSPVGHGFESARPEYLSNVLDDNATGMVEVTIIYLPFL